MDYYIEAKSNMRGYLKDVNKKLINMWTNEISVALNKSEAACKLNSWKGKESFMKKQSKKKWLIRW